MLLYVQDPDSRITYVNQSAAELSGKTPEEVVGCMPAELFDPAAVERWTAQNERVLRTGDMKPIGVIVGHVMRETKGRADGGEVNRLLRAQLGV